MRKHYFHYLNEVDLKGRFGGTRAKNGKIYTELIFETTVLEEKHFGGFWFTYGVLANAIKRTNAFQK